MEKISITISSSLMKFAAAHFTLFSLVARENIHGHNFTVTVKLESWLREDGLAFDYGLFKKRFAEYCSVLDEKLLLPLHSPYLKIDRQDQYIRALFDQETLLFLPRDVELLPIANSTVEGLAQYFLKKILVEQPLIDENQVDQMTVIVSSGPGQSGEIRWVRK
jgi:6-pyruvoyltetrahydropterin/6-carboxytetrahydropterin synthase